MILVLLVSNFKVEQHAHILNEDRQIGILEMYPTASTFDNYSSDRF